MRVISQGPYYTDHRTKVLWVRNFKVASTSLHDALTTYLWQYSGADAVNLIGDYRWVMFVRHPFSRLASYWYSEAPKKTEATFSELVDKILAGEKEDDVHATPQSRRALKPIDVLCKFENLAEDYKKVRPLFSWPKELPFKNVSTNPKPYKELMAQLTDAQREGLREYYKEDFKYGY